MKESSNQVVNKNRRSGLGKQWIVLLLLVITSFGAMAVKLFWLQVLQGSFYRKLSDENRIRLVSSPPIRGRILDTTGSVLVDNQNRYSLSVQPRLVDKTNWPPLRDRLSRLLGLSQEDLNSKFLLGTQRDPYRIILATNLSSQQVLRFKEREGELQGAQVDMESVRYYPYGTLAAHAIGYTQPITQEEFSILSPQGYEIRDRIGRTGVEAAYESTLRGEWGGEMLEVDAAGSVQRSLGLRSPKAGDDLKLTINLALQLAAENALKDKSAGAIVVLDPRTGAIRAMASRPNFDPNFFSKLFMSQKEYDDLFLSSTMPLFSRAINAYDPGSTWKPVTAIAGMESGKFPPTIQLNTVPCINYGAHCFPEHNRKGFGLIGYEEALAVSSNTFFYQVGVGVGSEALYEAAKKLGFDSLTGIEMSYEESKGLVGNKRWAEAGRGWAEPGTTPWIPEDIASASIGQAVVQVTPLQLARAYAVFANGGYLITPHLVEGDIDWLSTDYRTKVDIEQSTIETIRSGLRKVIQEGTGWRLNLPELPTSAGKSGTAEDSTGGKDHAWFVCFAPYEGTEIVIVAFAQNTPGGGSVHALPMAKEILEAWQSLQTAN